MSYLGTTDFMLEVAKGTVPDHMAVNKFGRATNGLQTTATDVWDRADAAATQQIWVAPTAARIHAIASTSDLDGKTGAPTSTGARTIRVYGLKTWDLAETNEDVTLDGTTPVNTAQSYVIIHRMKVLTHGTAGPNAGDITATAAVDGTVTAQISTGEGQTLMAIYGIPSIQTGYMTSWLCNAHESANPGTASEADFTLLINEHPDVDATSAGLLNKSNLGTRSTGSTIATRSYSPPMGITGPAIIKVQGAATAADVEGVAEFDLVVVNN